MSQAATGASTKGSAQIWNVPNMLTMARLVLVIPFGILLFGYADSTTARIVAAVIFLVASITDFMDGAIARKRGIVTSFGKVADPFADKALTGVALIGLSYEGSLPWWVTIVILAREFAVTLLRFWVLRYGVMPASRGGKAKTVSLIFVILLYLVPMSGLAADIRAGFMVLALILTIVTGIDYIVRALRMRSQAHAQREQAASS